MKRAPDEQRRRVCTHCTAVYFLKPSKKSAFCSLACRLAGRRAVPIPDRECPGCKQTFTPADKRSRYCGKRCAWIVTKGPEYNAEISQSSADARAAAQRDRSNNGRTYRKLKGRHEHRVVAEATLGRPLEPGEVVHHVDGDKRNNDPANLVVLTQSEHMREHGIGIPGKALAHKPWEHRRRTAK